MCNSHVFVSLKLFFLPSRKDFFLEKNKNSKQNVRSVTPLVKVIL